MYCLVLLNNRKVNQIDLAEANLMGYIWSRIADVPIHFAHDANVLVTIE